MAGGLGLEDLNLLSRIESNSANCSMVLEDIDLTIVWPCSVNLSLPAVMAIAEEEAFDDELLELDDELDEALEVVMPKAWGGTVTKRFPCRMIHLPVAL